MEKDIFKEYLESKEPEYRKIALTDCSYKKCYQNEYKQELPDEETNKELGTYGDALLKLALCQILYEEKVKNITEKKKNYENDKILVSVVAQNYDLSPHINIDKNDKNIPKDYDCEDKNGVFLHKYKYIATAVEALLAAFYLDNEKNFKLIVDIVKVWKELIDKNRQNG